VLSFQVPGRRKDQHSSIVQHVELKKVGETCGRSTGRYQHSTKTPEFGITLP
jgi:hypothetical protein